ncbi:glycoside hydrolase family 66 protein [Arcticibacter tournemirensis]|uniref:Cycloisomaltooligosaccharide glucanotransferase n=1 Tax=Arcticibacter tournemirensis TaxID=699437 RepID=A0A4Q0M4G6_9SPHI|nr:glycoside hydrolase family 66 protein [Arcticibacter tournemirensis]RXF67794.1 cycloisomaltooligosaccharide glucanotransferase [Arcticibacter tournemirensis]
MKIKFMPIALSLVLLVSGCKDYYETKSDPVVYGDTYFNASIHTDKAYYKPGETIYFTLKEKPASNVKVRYSYLGRTIQEENLSSNSWNWTAPPDDYRGYMVDIYEVTEGKEKIYHSIAVDVSSDWKKFPRYGFLSSYGNLSGNIIESNINNLNRYHINGVQFYDWMYDHHRPLAGTVDKPESSWPDLMGRTNYLSTVKGYIDAAHGKGMKAMFYNLAFGALSNAAADGVKEEWYLFKDANHSQKDRHSLDPPFRSSIYLTNPGDPAWQNYLKSRNSDVYAVLDFDGYHIDQLGDRGTVYNYNGEVVKLDEAYGSFIASMKQANQDKRLLMNAVSQYGQQRSIAKSAVDFLYTEVWNESRTFDQLASVIKDNNSYSDQTKATVLAAYMNYAKSNNTGFVNLPGILLTDAVIFSFGGAHLELGEHYLANEYFPNSNLQMKSETKRNLMYYYDFLVAYQNLLRDGGVFSSIDVTSADGKLSFQGWPASQGKVAVIGKRFANRDLVHLINFTDANSMEWRDTNGTQKEPKQVENAQIKITASKAVVKVWFASPDINGGVAQPLSFKQSGGEVTLSIPSLKYWDMVVLEY